MTEHQEERSEKMLDLEKLKAEAEGHGGVAVNSVDLLAIIAEVERLRAENARLKKEQDLLLEAHGKLGAQLVEHSEALSVRGEQVNTLAAQRDAAVAAKKVWRCFHCGFETADRTEASGHFGDRDDEAPICVGWEALNADGKIAECQSFYGQLLEEREALAAAEKQVEDLKAKLEAAEQARTGAEQRAAGLELAIQTADIGASFSCSASDLVLETVLSQLRRALSERSGALVARDFAVIDTTLEAACQVLRGGVLVDAANSNWPRFAKALAEHDAALTTEVRDKLVGSICLALHGTLALDGEVGDKLTKSINEHDAALVAEVFADVNSILFGGEIKMRPIPVEQLQSIARKVKENMAALLAEREARIAALTEELQAAVEANNSFTAEIIRLRERVMELEAILAAIGVRDAHGKYEAALEAKLAQARREGAAEWIEQACKDRAAGGRCITVQAQYGRYMEQCGSNLDRGAEPAMYITIPVIEACGLLEEAAKLREPAPTPIHHYGEDPGIEAIALEMEARRKEGGDA